MFDLCGRTALVTGASAGLGRHFGAVLARHGASVILAGRRTERLEEVAATILADGGQARTLALDMTDPASIAAATPALGRVDILVNNAGVTREAAFLDQTEGDWEATVGTNAKGMFLLTQAAARSMRERDVGGSIINIASVLGMRQAGGVASYAISKAAVVQLTKIAALELARFGIRVNAIAPGYFATELNKAFWESDAGKTMMKRIPQRRLGELPNLDGPLLLLASDASAYMTGAVIEVDGGHLVSSL